MIHFLENFQMAPNKYNKCYLCCINTITDIKKVVSNDHFCQDSSISSIGKTRLYEPNQDTSSVQRLCPDEYADIITSQVISMAVLRNKMTI